MANEKAKYPFGTFGIAFVNKVGEQTGESYSGNFEVKERLSLRDHLNKDSMRRSLLGDKPEAATTQAQVYAEALAHCSVSVVDAPPFWRNAGGGLDLYDDNLVLDLYEEIIAGQVKVAEAIVKKGEEAKTELKKEATRNKKTKAEPATEPATE